MIRKAFIMQVNADAHVEYQRRHNPIWPELEAVLKEHGAHHYAIYLDQERNLLFATVEIESEERWNAVASKRPMGAPVGLAVAADGAIWLADDRNGHILRIAKE